MNTTTAPAIGQLWQEQGGIYAGIIRGLNGASDNHLVVAPAETGEISRIAWGPYKTIKGADSYHDGRANTEAMAAAGLDLGKAIKALAIDGHTDWHLPSQAEMHLLAANLKDEFNQDDWYWTSTQYSAYYAWDQHFTHGGQGLNYLSYEGRARAVRLIPFTA